LAKVGIVKDFEAEYILSFAHASTTHLNGESETLSHDVLKRVMAGRTSIVVAHRLSTILAADQILVMDRGQIVERGTHEQLIALGGIYSQLYETQFRRERV